MHAWPARSARGRFPFRVAFARRYNSLLVALAKFVALTKRGGMHACMASVQPCAGIVCAGLSWSKPTVPAFGTIVHYTDNTTAVYDYCERPQIAQEPDGTPLTLFVGHGYTGIHTLALMFCQDGDVDCVTTVQ